PETLLPWHRQGFRLFWRHKSKAKSRQPRIPPDVVALIQRMALDNRSWGVRRIQDELHKLGYPLPQQAHSRQIHAPSPSSATTKSDWTDLCNLSEPPRARHLGVRFPSDLRLVISCHLCLLHY